MGMGMKYQRTRSLTNDKGQAVQVTVGWREASRCVLLTFFKSTLVVALPGVALNSVLNSGRAWRSTRRSSRGCCRRPT